MDKQEVFIADGLRSERQYEVYEFGPDDDDFDTLLKRVNKHEGYFFTEE